MTRSKPKAKSKKPAQQVESQALEGVAPAAPKKTRGKPAVDLAAAIVQAFATNERINQFLLEELDPLVWDAQAPVGKGRTIRAIVAHIHNVRHMWLAVADADTQAPEKVQRDSLTLEQARTALGESARALQALLRKSLDSGGRVKDFKPDVVGFLAYAISHEAHHRGQIAMLARMLGKPLSQAATFGMWEWRKRDSEAALPLQPTPPPA